MIERQTALDAIASSPWTVLAFSPDGELAEVVPLQTQPTAELVLDLAKRQVGGGAFRFVQQARLSEEQLDALLNGTAGAQDYARSHKLRPGINIPGQEKALAHFDRRRRMRALLRWCAEWAYRFGAVFR